MENWSREKLIEELQKKESENQDLRQRLKKQQQQEEDQRAALASLIRDPTNHTLTHLHERPLNHSEVARYSRQLILPEFGPAGQRKLSSSSVLVVGCGGLGCPAAIYLAAAGVGRLGLIDYDTVELNNLHRQILHTEGRVGMAKAASIALSVKALNSQVEVVPYEVALTSQVALGIISKYDIVLDCSDNVATRYLVNDACVLANKPLVSGSALRYEGHLMVFHHDGGPCYRCLHPIPPPPETVTNCSDGGVLGVVPGTIGCLQAMEAIKLASGLGSPLSQKLLLFDALEGMFRTMKLRGRKSDCEVCGEAPTITKLIDYEQFCGAAATDKDEGIKLLEGDQRVTVEEYRDVRAKDTPHLLIDVRRPIELEICALPSCINIPLNQLWKPDSVALIKEKLSSVQTKSIYCVCRRGNDSQLAVRQLESTLSEHGCQVRDIIGGLTAWANRIDPTLPVY